MTILKRDSLAVVMTGTTHTIDVDGKNAFIFYKDETEAHMLMPDGKRFSGRWEMLEDGYRVDWTDGPNGSWKLDHRPGAIDYLDAGGVVRGRLSRIEFGDSARLAQ